MNYGVGRRFYKGQTKHPESGSPIRKTNEQGWPFCTICKRFMPHDQFPLDRRSSTGVSSHCRKCGNENRRRANKIRAYNKWAKENPASAQSARGVSREPKLGA